MEAILIMIWQERGLRRNLFPKVSYHYSHEQKIGLCIQGCIRPLKPGGRYIECDYKVTEQKEEDFILKNMREYGKRTEYS